MRNIIAYFRDSKAADDKKMGEIVDQIGASWDIDKTDVAR
jgi:hypothetical protein